MTPNDLQAPMLHLGGTSRDALIDGYCSDREAVQRAIASLIEHGPNQRDYYLLPAGAWERAVEQHRARVGALERVRDELTRLVDAVDGGRATV